MRQFDADIWREVTGGIIAERIRRLLRVTPLVHAPALGRRVGADVWLKLESLQRTGSFKLRGAAARLCALALAHEARRGQEEAGQGGAARVITASAGNHGLGVAQAARHFGMSATGAGLGADPGEQARRHRGAGGRSGSGRRQL
jgi:threonine dehydratase